MEEDGLCLLPRLLFSVESPNVENASLSGEGVRGMDKNVKFQLL